jgi:hypothetical protein
MLNTRSSTKIGLALVIAALAGCSATSSGPASNGGPAAYAGPAAPGRAAAPAGAGLAITGGAHAQAQHPAARLAASGAQIVYTAQLTLQAGDVTAALDAASTIAQAFGGYVSAEDATSAVATITLKIPDAAYPAALGKLAGGQLGNVLSLRRGAQDVTQTVADVGSQVASDEAAISQLRALLSRAGSVADLLTVQNQIDSEESALESDLAQQRALNGETSYATVTVTIQQPPMPGAVPARHSNTPGLLAGLGAGWRAFRIAWSWLLAILGAIAPFAAAAALAVVILYATRRLRTRRP